MFDQEEIAFLLQFTGSLVERAVCGMKQGETGIHPYSMDGSTGCDYCDFSSICMYDEGYAANRPRMIEKANREQAMERMDEELQKIKSEETLN